MTNNKNDCIWIQTEITKEQINKTKQVLIDNEVPEANVNVVLQAIGYTLLDIELEDLIWEARKSKMTTEEAIEMVDELKHDKNRHFTNTELLALAHVTHAARCYLELKKEV